MSSSSDADRPCDRVANEELGAILKNRRRLTERNDGPQSKGESKGGQKGSRWKQVESIDLNNGGDVQDVGGVIEILQKKYGCLPGQRFSVLGKTEKIWRLRDGKTVPKDQCNDGWKWIMHENGGKDVNLQQQKQQWSEKVGEEKKQQQLPHQAQEQQQQEQPQRQQQQPEVSGAEEQQEQQKHHEMKKQEMQPHQQQGHEKEQRLSPATEELVIGHLQIVREKKEDVESSENDRADRADRANRAKPINCDKESNKTNGSDTNEHESETVGSTSWFSIANMDYFTVGATADAHETTIHPELEQSDLCEWSSDPNMACTSTTSWYDDIGTMLWGLSNSEPEVVRSSHMVAQGIVSAIGSDLDPEALCQNLTKAFAVLPFPCKISASVRVLPRPDKESVGLSGLAVESDPSSLSEEQLDLLFDILTDDPHDAAPICAILDVEASIGGARDLLPRMAEDLLEASKNVPRKLRIVVHHVYDSQSLPS